MARRATILKQERAKNPNLLLLDAGDTLLGQDLATETQGKIVIEAMNLMGYAAMTLGEADVEAGAPVLRQRATEARFPFLGANLGGDLPVKPYTLVKIGGREIGILGLLHTERTQIPAPGGMPFSISSSTPTESPILSSAAFMTAPALFCCARTGIWSASKPFI